MGNISITAADGSVLAIAPGPAERSLSMLDSMVNVSVSTIDDVASCGIKLLCHVQQGAVLSFEYRQIPIRITADDTVKNVVRRFEAKCAERHPTLSRM